MNQYDFIPQEPGKPVGAYAVGLLFLALFLWLVSSLWSCGEKQPMPTLDDNLHGAWQRQWMNMTNRYNFHDGACDAYAVIPAQPVQYYAYAYTTNGDTLSMLDLASGCLSRAVVSFPTDSTAVLSWVEGIDYFLKRI